MTLENAFRNEVSRNRTLRLSTALARTHALLSMPPYCNLSKIEVFYDNKGRQLGLKEKGV